MSTGKIAENNTRLCVTMPKELKTSLKMIAEDRNRSLNNLIVTVLKDYVEQSDSHTESMVKQSLEF